MSLEKLISYSVVISDNVGGSIVKARSVGASPRQLNIDPSALLPGAKPPPRGLHNAERAVSFDHPAQLTATLHSAGKVSMALHLLRLLEEGFLVMFCIRTLCLQH